MRLYRKHRNRTRLHDVGEVELITAFRSGQRDETGIQIVTPTERYIVVCSVEELRKLAESIGFVARERED